ncbi:hypothetical protein HYDPIDRAFT_115403 [Hydnomerulius pinastri MD-312]|uniref:Uncharacterized protein n=1 Tax=Hydnomerulius pinastri MD-312 TaxID=994086 RepID=A0A0C9WC94_9AGAM|nr:hypothetical protein HYDPIDRAFT_115403 [Hydnomerulius pinastri MD-312]
MGLMGLGRSRSKESRGYRCTTSAATEPLGVRERPVAHTKTWEDTRNELMVQDVWLQQHKQVLDK